MVPRDGIPEDFAKGIVEAARQTTVHPDELTWLDDILDLPTNPQLVARAAQRQLQNRDRSKS